MNFWITYKHHYRSFVVLSCRNCRSQMCQTTVAVVEKIGVTKNLIKMTGKYFSRRPFFVAVALLLHQNDTPEQGVSRELFEVFKNTFFIAQLRETSTSSRISSIKFSLWSKFHFTETYSKLSYTSKMNCLAKIFNDWKLLVIFVINSMTELWIPLCISITVCAEVMNFISKKVY